MWVYKTLQYFRYLKNVKPKRFSSSAVYVARDIVWSAKAKLATKLSLVILTRYHFVHRVTHELLTHL
jgi:hypothetical protein